MRQRNWRVVIVGVALVVLAIGFYIVMLGMASKSNDPAELMRTVGTVSGAVGGLALAMIAFGIVGKKV